MNNSKAREHYLSLRTAERAVLRLGVNETLVKYDDGTFAVIPLILDDDGRPIRLVYHHDHE